MAINSMPLVGVFFYNEDLEFDLDNKLQISACINDIIAEHNKQLGCINVILCSDEYLLKMNQEYLNHDYYTDILSFLMSLDPLSGDLFISVERVKDYSETNGVIFSAELNRVMIHGVLHFLGYNDKTPDEKFEMRNKEDFYLNTL